METTYKVTDPNPETPRSGPDQYDLKRKYADTRRRVSAELESGQVRPEGCLWIGAGIFDIFGNLIFWGDIGREDVSLFQGTYYVLPPNSYFPIYSRGSNPMELRRKSIARIVDGEVETL